MKTPQISKGLIKDKKDLKPANLGVVIYAILLGIVVALIAGLFESSFKFLAAFWHDSNVLLEHIPRWALYGIGPFLAVPILYYLLQNIPEKRQHNPADLIAGIHIHNGKINAKSSFLSALASIFSIGFGFSVGYYTPTVQLGAGIGFIMHKIKLISPNYYYISIGAGVAAAIAAIFQAPIGAVVFVHEVLFRFFSIRAFAPVTIAAVTGYIVSKGLFDKVIFFNIAKHFQPDVITHLAAAFAGTLAAIVGVLMIRLIIGIEKKVIDNQVGMWKKLFLAAALTSVIIISVPQAAGSSLQSVHGVISGTAFGLAALLTIFIAKFLATTVAFGFGVPGGIFGATLFIGASLGGLIASCAELLFPNLLSAEQIIIITTMAAMLSSVIGAPIAITLIVIEITGDFQILSVIMLAVVMANITAYRMMGTSSFFDVQLKQRGYDFELGRDRLYADNQNISDLISSNYLAINKSTNLVIAEKQLFASNQSTAVVIDDDGNLIGQVSLVDIKYYLQESGDTEPESEAINLSHVTHLNVDFIYRGTSIWEALEVITQTKASFIPVIDAENNQKLLGVVYSNMLIERYMKFVQDLRTQESAMR